MDCAALADAILSQDQVAWDEDKYRQEEYEVHKQTESIVLVTESPLVFEGRLVIDRMDFAIGAPPSRYK